MKTYVALLRGINVGGKTSLPMKELVSILEDLDCRNVRTYIQSGNAVFQNSEKVPDRLSKKIRAAIKDRCGLEPQVLLLRPGELQQAVDSNPFPAAESKPTTLHVNFLAKAPAKPDLPALDRLKNASEQFELKDRCFYLHAPDGIGRSKLATGAERLLGVPMTGRNWRTVMKLMEIVKQASG